MPPSRAAHKSAVAPGRLTAGSAPARKGAGVEGKVIFRQGLTSMAGALLAGAPLAAQDGAFSLPSPTTSANSRAQGPVDPDNPVLAPRPAAPPSPAATSIATGPAPIAAASPATPAATASPAARTQLRRAPAPVPSAPLPPPDISVPSDDAPTAAPVTPASEAPSPSSPAIAAPLPENGKTGTLMQPALGVLAAVLALLAGLWLLLKRRRAPEEGPEPDEVAPQPADIPPPPPAPPPPAPAPALPVPTFAQAGIALEFVPRRMAATLVNAALDYEVTVTNTGAETVELIALAGDMLGAHASLKAEDAGAGDGLPVLHRVPRLAAGDSARLTGTIRLPLGQIVPITHGSAQLFVALVRFALKAESHGGEALALADTFVVGEPPQAPGGGVKPFRLDLGPRIYADLAARKVSAGG